MSFLKKILKNPNVNDQVPKTARGFASLSQEEIDAHLGIDRYGDFLLTDAIRPSYELEVIPQAGYRWDHYDDKATGVRIPVLIASASREDLFDLFLDLLAPLGDEVDIVLETSHASMGDEHRDHHRERMDLPILMSTLYDFEEMLTHDGCAGIAVLNPRMPMEVQLDEHKLIVMYGRDLERMEAILMSHGLRRSDKMKFITEAEHVHSSTEQFQQQFENLCYQLALDDM